MTVVDVGFIEESQTRYLTYALSVVNSRALPDVRDGLKPVQRRILYAMQSNLHLTPDKQHRKSAAVVGEVLARYHPHGDAACYEAMVRMAQDFSLRYPLVDGQGNFGSLDGDSAAAYRYTETRLTPLALEVIGDIGQETVAERENFDQTTKEPVVLPSRVPNLLINGASGIAVGMATAIPPHNLEEVVKALLLLLEDAEVPDTKLLGAIKGPDFPTGGLILNTRAELKEIYATGRGAIRMRSSHSLEQGVRGRDKILITSVPYGADKSVIVEKIAELIIEKKVPQLSDVRDESTTEVRIVLELAPQADPDQALAYLFKHTGLQTNFHVNLTALVPTKNPLSGRPVLLSLREMLRQFLQFRLEVTRAKLLFEKKKLDQRIHLLEGLVRVLDFIDVVIELVRRSDGRSDAIAQLQKRFALSELQATFLVDLRIYQLSKTSIAEVSAELKEKSERVSEIERILGSERALKKEIALDLERIAREYGDPRKSKIVSDLDEVEFDKEQYVQHEEVFVVVTKDGWLKRIKNTNDPQNTRLREGDELFFVQEASTRDSLALFSNRGNLFVTRVYDLSISPGFGDPVQKMFRFQDDERVVKCLLLKREKSENGAERNVEVLLYSERGLGFRSKLDLFSDTKKIGRRVAKFSADDELKGAFEIDKPLVLLVSKLGYCLCIACEEVPLLAGAGKGVILQRLPKDDALVIGVGVEKKSVVKVALDQGKMTEVDVKAMTIETRAKRGLKLIKRGVPVVGLGKVRS